MEDPRLLDPRLLDPRLLDPRIVLAILLGLTSHVVVFKKGEWHVQAPYLLAAAIAAVPVLTGIEELSSRKSDVAGSFRLALSLFLPFVGSLFVSIGVYRLLFHRLRHFPGPRLAGLSKLWHAYYSWGGKNYLLLQQLHEQYGDFVRTGPNEVTVFTPDVLVKLNGPGNANLKSAWYDILLPEFGVATIRDRRFHDQRRRLWVNGFAGKELAVYQQRIMQHGIELEEIVAEAASAQKTVDFKNLTYWFSFDVMGLFVFDRSFNLISTEEWRYAFEMLRRAFAIVAPVSPVPWLAHIGFTVFKRRWVVRPWHGMIDWCRDRMFERIDSDNGQRDVASRLVHDYQSQEGSEFAKHLLVGESIVAIVAGSDTVGSAATFAFYELAKHPEQVEKLFAELQTVNIHDTQALLSLPHLNAVINETLRYHHVIPTGGYRDTPEEGLTISGRFIPAGTTIIAPRYILNRMECAFEKADEWIPERWTSSPEMIKDNRVHLPFALGRYACPGKQLALSEISTLIALLVNKYKFRFPAGDNGSRVEDQMIDQFTALPGPLDLVFEHR